jgi:hypothetical protein
VRDRGEVVDGPVQNNQPKESRSVLSWRTSLAFGVGHVLNDLVRTRC